MARRYALLGSVAALVLFLDQLSKWAVMRLIPEHRPVTVIAGLFDLVNIRNRGAAFGFLNRSDMEWQFWLFLAATIVAVGAILLVARSEENGPCLLTGLGCIMGGRAGQPGGQGAVSRGSGLSGHLLERLALARI